jgi:pimeloyl-ACP methyl ester carboxylesterase
VRIQNLIPAAQLEILRPAGHMGLLEQHVRFNEVVARFSTACFERTGVAAAG